MIPARRQILSGAAVKMHSRRNRLTRGVDHFDLDQAPRFCHFDQRALLEPAQVITEQVTVRAIHIKLRLRMRGVL